VTKKRKSGEGVIFRGIMSGLVAFLMVGNLSAREPALAVIAEDLSGEVGEGGLEMVESLAEAGVMESTGVSLVSRRHLEKILSEQGLAYNNVVNDRARLGRLAGADILLIVSIAKNRVTQSRESVSAYGITENIVRCRHHCQSPRSRERSHRGAKAVCEKTR
jgi:predicted ATPase